MRDSFRTTLAGIALACATGTVSFSGDTRPRMSPEDILTIRRLGGPQIAPDGSAVAFVVRQARPEHNDYVATLTLVKSSGDEAPQTLATSEKGEPTSIRWTPDSRALTYLSSADGTTLRRHGLESSEASVLFQHSTRISQHEWSRDGRFVAFVTSAPQPERDEPAGMVYDPADAIDDPFVELTRPARRRTRDEVWLYDVERRAARRLWQAKPTSSRTTISWAPDSERLAIAFWKGTETADGVDSDFDVVSARDGATVRRIAWPGLDALPAWAPDGKSLAFVSEGDLPPTGVGEVGRRPAAVYVLTLESGHVSRVAKAGDFRRGDSLHWSRSNRLYSERQTTALGGSAHHIDGNLFETSPSTGRIGPLFPGAGNLSSCAFALTVNAAACVTQDLRRPPEIALLDLGTRAVRPLTTVNAHLNRFAMAPIVERVWKSRYGQEGSGYLLTPTPDTARPPYPTLVVMYGFMNRFTADAQWIASYPVETLVAEGFAVLLLNWTNYPFRYFDGDEGMIDLVHNPLDTVASAVDMLAEEGIADRQRLGILGWSRGCYITSLAVTRTDTFKAASCGDGYLWTPGSYWLTRGITRFHVEGYFGGAPYGETRARYDVASPIHTAGNTRAAVLLEYVAENFKGLELFVALRHHKVAAEYVAYPGESHVFTQPRHRLASMHRNLDWFKYWLLDRRDEDPRKKTQYDRWDKLKRERP